MELRRKYHCLVDSGNNEPALDGDVQIQFSSIPRVCDGGASPGIIRGYGNHP